MYLGSMFFRITFANYRNRSIYFSTLVALSVYFSLVIYFNCKPGRQCIYNGCTYTMQTSGYFVSSATKFSTSMQYSKNNFQSRYSGLVVHSNRNTTTIIFNCDGIILLNCNFNAVAITSQSFVHSIIYNLVYQMMQTSCRCTSDVHTRSFSYCLKTFKNLNLVSAISLIVLYFFAH